MSEKSDYIAPPRAEAPVFLTGELQKILVAQIQKVRSLVKKDCCNYSAGNCVFLDDGFEHPCPQLSSDGIYCSWFKEAVLPGDTILEAEIVNSNGTAKKITLKKCTVCGKSLAINANRAKYCQTCAKKIHRKQKTENDRKRRRSMRTIRAV